MSVVPDFPIVAIREETQIPNRTYKLDFDKNRIIGYVDGEEAIQQAIVKTLYTPRFGCYAYDDQYGNEVKRLLSDKNLTMEYVEAEMKFLLQDALCADGRIYDIKDMELKINGDEVFISFSADTTLGKIQTEGANKYV